MVRQQMEAQQGTAGVITRRQQQEVSHTGEQSNESLEMIQKTCDDEWQLQFDAWMKF